MTGDTAEVQAPADAATAVDVWWLDLDVGEDERRALEATLSGDEVARADRMRFRVDRDRFVAGRAKLRALLGGLLGIPAASVDFSYGAHGKPRLQSGDVFFNLAHSQGRGLVAMCGTVAVGIDLEHVGAFAGIDLLASRFFSPGEVAALRRMGQEARVPAFYRCWTRKEAIVKGVGLGLSMPLDHFEVDVDRCIGPAVRWTGPEPDLTAAWSLIDLSPDETWAAAVAVGAGDAEVAVHADPALAGSIAL